MTRLNMYRFLVLAVAMTALAVSAPAQADTMEIVVSPSTLNLASNGGCVTIHAEIKFSAVDRVELYVDGQAVGKLHTFADSRGDLVVRCGLAMIKSMVSEGVARFDLTAYTAGGAYTGTDTIRVINRGETD